MVFNMSQELESTSLQFFMASLTMDSLGGALQHFQILYSSLEMTCCISPPATRLFKLNIKARHKKTEFLKTSL